MKKGGKFKEIRCNSCNKLLALENYKSAVFELKCLRCGQINSVLSGGDYLIFITDRRGIILYVNEKVKKITGIPPKKFLGKVRLYGVSKCRRNFTKSFGRIFWLKKEL